MLIVFEGPNGAGKTTLVNRLISYFEKDYDVYKTCEPTDDPFGKCLKEIEDKYDSLTYLFLITSNRSYHNTNEIVPKSNKIIFCDRYIATSLALQSSQGVSMDFIWDINKCFCQPDITFFISASSEELGRRLTLREKRTYFEKKLTRKQEIELYRNAYMYMKKKGAMVYWFDNNENEYDNTFLKVIQIIKERVNIYE